MKKITGFLTFVLAAAIVNAQAPATANATQENNSEPRFGESMGK